MDKVKMCQCEMDAFPFFPDFHKYIDLIVQNYSKFINTASASTTP